ncbi:MAG TPA: hypothetical protein VN893_07715 [Bryobacteraceae bacterium]|nr:hypothetical protein [Bryobacteraceae bacterium]
MSPGESQLRLAEAAAEHARRLLLFPSIANLDRSRSFLEQACANLEEVRRLAAGQPPARNRELRAGLTVLHRTGRRVAALLEGAARFRAGWFEALKVATTAGYNQAGEPAPSAPPRTISVEG